MTKQKLQSQLELKSLKFHKGHDYFDGFSAILLWNGKKIAEIYDDSYGGGYRYTSICSSGKLKALFTEVKKLQKYPNEFVGHEVQLDFLIDTLVNDAKCKKDEKKGIVYKARNGWDVWGWDVTLPTMLKKYKPTSVIARLQQECNKMIKDNKEILNKDYLQSIGIKFK